MKALVDRYPLLLLLLEPQLKTSFSDKITDEHVLYGWKLGVLSLESIATRLVVSLPSGPSLALPWPSASGSLPVFAR